MKKYAEFRKRNSLVIFKKGHSSDFINGLVDLWKVKVNPVSES